MGGMGGSTCKFCGAKLRWERNDYDQRWVPLDALPTTRGTFKTTPTGCLELGGMSAALEPGLKYTRHDCDERRRELGLA